MPTFIAFLRAVNVGKRAYPMAELRAVLTEAGFEDVETHIQTGNVRVRTSKRSTEKVRAELERVLAADRGFEVPACLFTPAELVEVREDGVRFLAELEEPVTSQYAALFQGRASAADVKEFEAREVPGESVRIGARAGHLMLRDKPFHEARTGNDVFERTFGTATTRNLTVISKLAEKWGP